MRTLVVFCCLAAVGCKGKPKAKAPPPNAASGTVNGSGDRAAPDLLLPHSDGTPPKKTTAPLGKADFEKLSKLQFPGFTGEVRQLGDKVLEMRYRTNDRPVLWAVVTVSPCLDCIPMELDKWQAKEAELRSSSLEVLRDAPDIVWEMGSTRMNGAPVIYTYQLGTSTGMGAGSGSAAPSATGTATLAETATVKGSAATAPVRGSGSGSATGSGSGSAVGSGSAAATEGGGSYSFTDNYVAYYNDGVNQIRVVGAYKDDPASKANLAKMAPKDDLGALALAFLDVYTHAW